MIIFIKKYKYLILALLFGIGVFVAAFAMIGHVKNPTAEEHRKPQQMAETEEKEAFNNEIVEKEEGEESQENSSETEVQSQINGETTQPQSEQQEETEEFNHSQAVSEPATSLDSETNQTSPGSAANSDGLAVEIEKVNGWQENSNQYVQYNVKLTNTSDVVLEDWELDIGFSKNPEVRDVWGAELSKTADGLQAVPVSYTRCLQAGETKEFGMIIWATEEPQAGKYCVRSNCGSYSGNLQHTGNSGGHHGESSHNNHLSTEQTSVYVKPQNVESGDYGKHGSLCVRGTDLCNGQGEVVQLRGVSTHGLSWFPQYVNREAFSSLKNMGINTIRLAMYTSEYNGYCNGGNQQQLKDLIKNGVRYAAELGMYVIIDWHILHDNNPNQYLTEAMSFFDEMSRSFASYGNVLYEICNEPNSGTAWDDGTENDIKSYAEKVIPVIRKNDADAVIIVGTPTWSQDVDVVAESPLNQEKYSNIMYALHFYAATHKESLQKKLIQARQNGLPIFVSEFSICEASGNGQNDTTSADTWMNLLNSYGISTVAWSLSNKAESCSLLKSSCQKTGNFTIEDFSESGKWYFGVLD